MKKLFFIILVAFAPLATFGQAKDILDIAIGSEDYTTFVAALKAADLEATLKGAGPFTVFVPTNAAFDEFGKELVSKMFMSKAISIKIFSYHVVSGSLDVASIITSVKANNGNIVLKTISGHELIVTLDNGKVKLTDEAGRDVYLTEPALKGTNGIVHVINHLLLSK